MLSTSKGPSFLWMLFEIAFIQYFSCNIVSKKDTSKLGEVKVDYHIFRVEINDEFQNNNLPEEKISKYWVKFANFRA